MNTITEKDIRTIPEANTAFAVLFISAATRPAPHEGEVTRFVQQRLIGERAAERLKVRIVAEFVEIGSALNWQKRQVLQEMLAFLRDHPDVGYAIFPGPHRFSRNSLDSAILRKEFDALGVTVVFSTNPTSEIPSQAETNKLLATMADTLRTDIKDTHRKRYRDQQALPLEHHEEER